MGLKNEQYIWGLLRISLGLIFLWAFIDKVFGLGIATKPESAWLAGGSPTSGFLEFGAHGPLKGLYNSLAGNVLVDWLFMLGLLFVGITLILGISVKLGSYAGALMVFLMWTALLPPENHPFLDDHIIYGLVLIGLTFVKSGEWLGFGKKWSKTKLVKKYKWLN